MPVDADDPPLGRHRMDDAEPMLVEQRVELGAKGRERARLHLDELAVGADEIDHEPAEGDLEPITRTRHELLDRGVQRALAQHPDARHAGDRSRRRGRIGPRP